MAVGKYRRDKKEANAARAMSHSTGLKEFMSRKYSTRELTIVSTTIETIAADDEATRHVRR
jgi:hypothetical protein